MCIQNIHMEIEDNEEEFFKKYWKLLQKEQNNGSIREVKK